MNWRVRAFLRTMTRGLLGIPAEKIDYSVEASLQRIAQQLEREGRRVRRDVPHQREGQE